MVQGSALAVFADVHGKSWALGAVLEDLDRRAPRHAGGQPPHAVRPVGGCREGNEGQLRDGSIRRGSRGPGRGVEGEARLGEVAQDGARALTA